MPLDAIDRKILRLLQADAQIQNADLAAKVGLSPSPCHRRVKALEAAGVIRGYVALLDGKAVGAGFVAFVEVRLERQSSGFAERFERAVVKRPEVLECCLVTGDADYLLKVAVADLDDFHAFLMEVLTRIEGVANTRTVIPVKRLKETTALRVA
ncbi:MAG: Lrp/AsnC family transcriptional regulator [Rhizobiales bacterium]|nr:Lrp/AsnC family transcriptional regulator [Hyphomicrobiales bacterium]